MNVRESDSEPEDWVVLPKSKDAKTEQPRFPWDQWFQVKDEENDNDDPKVGQLKMIESLQNQLKNQDGIIIFLEEINSLGQQTIKSLNNTIHFKDHTIQTLNDIISHKDQAICVLESIIQKGNSQISVSNNQTLTSPPNFMDLLQESFKKWQVNSLTADLSKVLDTMKTSRSARVIFPWFN